MSPPSSDQDNADPGEHREAQRAQLEGLFELTKRLSEPLQAEEVASVVVHEARAAVGAATAIMWAVDDPPTHATLLRATGYEPDALERYARIPLEPWLPMGDAMLRREPLFFESRVEFRNRYALAEKRVTGQEPFGELSYVCLPLIAHGRAIGGVALVFSGARTFHANERMFLTVLAHHAAQALERAGLFEREKQVRLRLESLQRLTSALSSAATVESVAELATRVAVEALGFAAAVVWAADEHGNLRLVSDHGMASEDRETFRNIPVDSAFPAARVARDRCAVWCEGERDLESEDPQVVAALRRDNTVRAYGALPLVRQERVLGVIVFSAGRPWRFLPEERAFMTSVAEHCADAFARARQHDEARRMERLFKSVLERLPVGIIVSRPPESTPLLSNEALARIWRTGAFPDRGEDRCKMLKVMFPDGRPMPMNESPVVRALGGAIVDYIEAKIERADGSNGWIHVSAAPVLRDDGGVEVAVATVVDVTAEKEARAAAEEAGRVKDEFLAMLGHELRNPLTPIVTALNLMDLRGGEAFRSERTTILHQVRHVMRLVDDLLDVSRITSGKILLKKKRIEVAQAVSSAVETASPLFEQRSQNLTVSVPQDGLPVVVDPGRLSQAVANLLTNAAKYTGTGGDIAITAAREAGQVCIVVRDSGIGIDPKVLPKVFDPFVQAKRSIDRSQGGLGIGLTVVRKLVEIQDGSVTAFSAGIGRGSEFVIRLPLAPSVDTETPLASARAPVAQAAIAAPWRVLVVDDNEVIANGLAATLKALGCVTRIAHDGPSAIAAAKAFDADLALLDIGLPVMDGYEIARRFRRTKTTSAMRLVAVTGYGQTSDKQKAIEAGFDDHIVKPFQLDTIRDVLSDLRIKPVAGRSTPAERARKRTRKPTRRS
jgi:signal transduction histidine kinase/ActR/RegA family two-component response regulator/transcriptional regulator with GAF, ATPase, and Fis domain